MCEGPGGMATDSSATATEINGLGRPLGRTRSRANRTRGPEPAGSRAQTGRNTAGQILFTGEFILQSTRKSAAGTLFNPATSKNLKKDHVLVKVVKHQMKREERATMKTPSGIILNDAMDEVLEWACRLVSYEVQK